MVSQRWREKGIFSSLLLRAIHLAREEGYDMLLTIANNPFSFRSFVRTGFIHVTDFFPAKRFISPDGLAGKSSGLVHSMKRILLLPTFALYNRMYPQIHHDYEIRKGPVSEFADEIEDFAGDGNFPGICGERTKSFVLWRFCRAGGDIRCLTLWKQNRLAAYLIHSYSATRKNGVILDVRTEGDSITLAEILVSEAVSALAKEHAGSLSAFQLDRKWEFARLFSPRHGFFGRSPLAGHVENSHFLVYCLNKCEDTLRYFEKNSWNIQAADTCLFPPDS
jgi:hypothetical protein